MRGGRFPVQLFRPSRRLICPGATEIRGEGAGWPCTAPGRRRDILEDAAFAGYGSLPYVPIRCADYSNYWATRSVTAAGSWNWVCSVELVNAVVDDCPPAMTCVTSSKYPTPTNS